MAVVYILKVIFVSWMIGHASTLLLTVVIPKSKSLAISFIRNEKFNKRIGVGICKRVLTNSFIKYFNRRLQITGKKPSLSELVEIREAINYAEIVHLIGFAYVVAMVIKNIVNQEYQLMIVPLLVVNIILNLYPVLVQQMNKRRIDRVMGLMMKRAGMVELSSIRR